MATNATTTQKQRAIKYLNRDFESLKRDFIDNHLKVYFANTYQDFNESSIGMMLSELGAFFGDNMSFYIDKAFNESFIDSARQLKSIFRHAKQLGFKAFGKSSAFGTVDCYIALPATTVNQQILPDMRYAGVVRKGAKLKSQGGQTYETLEDADFSTVDINNPDYLTVANRDPATKQPLTFSLKLKNIAVKAGETKSTTVTVQAYQPFLTVTLPDNDILEIISMVDSQNNKWYEVDFLAQDTVFDGVSNTGTDLTQVPFVMKLRSVPYRFVTQYDVSTGKTSLVFGTGDATTFDHDLVPNLSDLSIPSFGKDTFTDFSIDPQNFLKTRTLGLAPINTTLTIKYRVGGGASTNAGTNQVKVVAESFFDVGDSTLLSTTIRDVKNSFSVLNPAPITGGRDEFSSDEIKQLISANYAAQGRCVTTEDFIARTLSMPSKFGSIFRAHPQAGRINKNSVELVVLSKDTFGNVAVATDTLKQNLKTYLARFRMLTDAIEILDGRIVNLKVSFGILVRPEYNRTEVLTDCLNRLQDFFIIDKWQIGQPVNRTDLHYLIADVPGVLSVYELIVSNLAGTLDGRTYSMTTYNIAKNTKNNIIYCDQNTIFSVAYPTRDIIGIAK